MNFKDTVVAGSITVAFSFVGWAHMMIIDLKDDVSVLQNEILYMTRTLDGCIQNDLYQVDKLYMIERFKNLLVRCDD